jgi:hypothetical protein
MSNFMKIISVRDELFHADGQTDRQTDMTKLILAFAILRKELTNLNNNNNNNNNFIGLDVRLQ